MDRNEVIRELKQERERLTAAIDALEGLAPAARRGRKPGRHMSADARRRIGLAMKKRWAERKRKGGVAVVHTMRKTGS